MFFWERKMEWREEFGAVFFNSHWAIPFQAFPYPLFFFLIRESESTQKERAFFSGRFPLYRSLRPILSFAAKKSGRRLVRCKRSPDHLLVCLRRTISGQFTAMSTGELLNIEPLELKFPCKPSPIAAPDLSLAPRGLRGWIASVLTVVSFLLCV